jgi:hypothetical protein
MRARYNIHAPVAAQVQSIVAALLDSGTHVLQCLLSYVSRTLS